MKTQDEYNEWFKEMLKKHLSKLYTIEKLPYEKGSYLRATISHPSNNEKDIIIATHDKELTLYFWKHHEHHDSFEDDDHEQEFIDLCEYIEDIINDKVYFSVSYNGDSVLSGFASYDLQDHTENEATRIEIKTWSGKLDETIKR